MSLLDVFGFHKSPYNLAHSFSVHLHCHQLLFFIILFLSLPPLMHSIHPSCGDAWWCSYVMYAADLSRGKAVCVQCGHWRYNSVSGVSVAKLLGLITLNDKKPWHCKLFTAAVEALITFEWRTLSSYVCPNAIFPLCGRKPRRESSKLNGAWNVLNVRLACVLV